MARITIEQNAGDEYVVKVEGAPDGLWIKNGPYNTPEAVIDAFKHPIKSEYRLAILDRLKQGEKFECDLSEAMAVPLP